MNVLISSGGRRVGLTRCFRESLTELQLPGRIIGIDATPYSSIAHFTDAFYTVPHCTDETFIPKLRQICEREQIGLIVPSIDTELPVYAAVKDSFRQELGIAIAISTPDTVEISRNKTLTHCWLCTAGFPVPRQSTPQEVLRNLTEWPLPVVVKPNNGSASVGMNIVRSTDALALAAATENLILQELVPGFEHTVNIFVNRKGQCICAVPHMRLEVRAGEVSKAKTVKDPTLMQMAKGIGEALPGAYGALNVQCFVTPNGDIRVIEINARFGGGYPLAHQAGAKMTTWLLQDVMGEGPQAYFDDWENSLVMLRYDEAVFSSASSVQFSGMSDVQTMHRFRS